MSRSDKGLPKSKRAGYEIWSARCAKVAHLKYGRKNKTITHRYERHVGNRNIKDDA